MKKSKQIWVYFDNKTDVYSDFFKGMLNTVEYLKEQSSSELIYISAEQISQQMEKQVIHFKSIDKIIFNNTLEKNSNSAKAKILAQMAERENPKIIIFPSNQRNKEISSRLSILLEAGLTADCLELEYVGEEFIFSRTANGDSVIAKIKGQNSTIQICTLKESSQLNTKQELVSEEKSIQSYDFLGEKKLCRKVVKEILKSAATKIEFNKAKIIFGIGRGVSTTEDIERIKNIAQKIGAEYGCTKSISDSLLMEETRKIGQSGQVIAPDLYIAIGISGSTQHLVGIKNSKQIVAINNDSDAPIFKYADVGILGDAHEFIKELETLYV